jgi:photosystem II stability/assembly factor-like uncharacterized protein
LPVSFTSGNSVLGLYATADGGRLWTLTGTTSTNQYLNQGVNFPADVLEPNSVIAVTADGSKVVSTADSGRNWSVVSPNGLPGGVIGVDFASSKIGWALVFVGACKADKGGCTQSQDLFKTGDGGQTWQYIDLAGSVD